MSFLQVRRQLLAFFLSAFLFRVVSAVAITQKNYNGNLIFNPRDNHDVEARSDLKFDRAACQAPTADPLEGCPKGTLLVGGNASVGYATVQSAVVATGNGSDTAYILVLPGNYTEQVNVTRSAPLYIFGQTSSPKDQAANTVSFIWAAVAGTGDNAYTSTLTIAPDLAADLTGSGTTGYAVPANQTFGNTDFRLYNVDVINDFLPYSDGPSLTVSMGYANAGFYYSGFYSYQDTIYIGKLGNAYFYNSTIAGQTDFLYGFGTCWIEQSTLLLRSCGGGITAWKGTNTTFENKYGVYITKSSVVKANASLEDIVYHKCALGRPWNAQHRSIFSFNYLDDSILPAGYIIWSATDPRVNNYTFMAEYKDYGPGFNLTARETLGANVTIELTAEEFEPYSSVEKVFQYPDGSGRFGNVGWIDFSA